MNQSIRNAWVAALVLFTMIFGSVAAVQFFQQENLEQNAWNTRRIVRDFGMDRGSILVDGKPIAESIPAEGQFPFKRVYADSPMYSYLTGFYALSTGTSQLEAAENAALSGVNVGPVGERVMQLFTGNANQGSSVETTINPNLQRVAFNAIPEGLKASVVALDPKTGAVLAMASKPTYDANRVSGTDTEAIAQATQEYEAAGISIYQNPAVSRTVAPGSVFKIIDTVAALESGKYNKDSVMPNPPATTFPGITDYTLPNYAGGNCTTRSEADFAFAFAQSCNSPFISIAQDLGNQAIKETAQKFGFGQKLSIPVPVEPSSLGETDYPTNSPEFARTVIGQQDVRMTPLQVAMMASAIANDGTLMKPNMVKNIRTPDLQVVEAPEPEVFSTVTTPEIANQITTWMEGVVENGTATGAAVPGVKVAAKSGTADIGNEVSAQNTNSWITGFAPADDPKIAFAIVIENTDVSTGNRVNGAIAKQLIEAVLNQ
ncbi:peptidoglycan D,D-transpeptidase FtsI family protein [Haematomicrobium sanguinis]|uniref:peptidoglycan D,D-transpeptidase FtsI family protein n=1 Tax=Haematomicrobium sanguinis TaxID=479106 RepID=UPI00047B19A6|nr:penicillin-binding protein 2 [Haematomicrobium sanguinis]